MGRTRTIRMVCTAILLALVLGQFGTVSAQDMNIPSTRDISLLTALGLPQIDLVAEDGAITGLPTETEAGQYLVTLTDKTENEVEAFFIAPIPGKTFDEISAEVATMTHDDLPSFFFDIQWNGGPNAYNGQTDGVVLNLTPGEWWVITDFYTESSSYAIAKLTATGDAATPAPIDGAVPVTMKEFGWDMPEITAGEQIWQLENSGKQPHFTVMFEVPAGTTYTDLMAVVMADGSATPVPGSLGSEPIDLVYDSSILSPGNTMLIQVGLPAGTYAMLCWFTDAETMQPHAMMGMANVFTVK